MNGVLAVTLDKTNFVANHVISLHDFSQIKLSNITAQHSVCPGEN